MQLVILVAALLITGGTGVMGCSKSKPREHAGERVYVSDEDGGNVVVINASDDSVVTRIPVGKRPRGLRVSPDGTQLFVALSGLPKAGPGVDERSEERRVGEE